MANRLSNGPMQITGVTLEEINYCFLRIRQELDEVKGLRGPIEFHDRITGLTLTEDELTLSDVTTDDVTSSKHGFAPKSPADATKFLNGGTTPGYALVKDSDLSTSDITTNNASITKHGFLKKLSNASTDFLDGTGVFDTVKDSDLSTSDIATNNVTTSKHGFTPKLPNDATKYLDGTGAYTVPVGSGGSGSITVAEQDGSPSVASVTTLKFNNGTVTDNGSGTVSVDVTGATGGLLTYSFTLTDTQLKAMFAAPITIIAAAGTNTVIQPVELHFKTDFSAGAYVQNNSINLYWAGVNPALVSSVSGYTSSTTKRYITENVLSQAIDLTAAANQALTISNTTSALTGGNAANSINATLKYYLIDVT